MTTELNSWALPRLRQILPLDDGSLQEILTYTSSLSKEAGAEHLKNMLGDSEKAFEFISGFNMRREDVDQGRQAAEPSTGVPRPAKKQNKAKAPLHKAGPMRQPEGYGNIAGGYTKKIDDDSRLSRGHKRDTSSSSLTDALPLSQNPEALQVPSKTQGGARSPSNVSRDASPGTPSLLPPSATGRLISDLPNVRTKQSKKTYQTSQSQPQSGSSTPHGSRPATTTTSSIADLTSAIAALELSTNPTLSSQRRKCDCNASIHPLFTTAPNCLNCGKIICALEGLQPCSYCDAPILSKEQVAGMIKALKEERGIEKMVSHNVSVATARSGAGTPMFSSTPDTSGDESSSAAARARAHRDKLLAYQRENAQRTKVHDEAADFDTTLTHGQTQWMTPTQRAAALKKQQQYLRELEEANRPEWEKKKTVMSMSVKNGKLVKTYERVQAQTPKASGKAPENDPVEVDNAQRDIQSNSSGAFSKNPLLVGGALIRPVWKPKDGEVSAGKEARERRTVWRRVQDSNDDNEEWLLDGGLRGFDVESRLMEDGSQMECG